MCPADRENPPSGGDSGADSAAASTSRRGRSCGAPQLITCRAAAIATGASAFESGAPARPARHCRRICCQSPAPCATDGAYPAPADVQAIISYALEVGWQPEAWGGTFVLSEHEHAARFSLPGFLLTDRLRAPQGGDPTARAIRAYEAQQRAATGCTVIGRSGWWRASHLRWWAATPVLPPRLPCGLCRCGAVGRRPMRR